LAAAGRRHRPGGPREQLDPLGRRRGRSRRDRHRARGRRAGIPPAHPAGPAPSSGHQPQRRSGRRLAPGRRTPARPLPPHPPPPPPPRHPPAAPPPPPPGNPPPPPPPEPSAVPSQPSSVRYHPSPHSQPAPSVTSGIGGDSVTTTPWVIPTFHGSWS